MPLLAVAYPRLTSKNSEWLEAYRAEHDEQFGKFVKAHFTLVFSVEGMEVQIFTQHVHKKVAKGKPVPFRLESVRLAKDAFSNYWQVYLVPSVGYLQLKGLHDALYTGILASHLRKDIPYVPHITVGSSRSKETCEQLAAKLEASSVKIDGIINAVTVVTFHEDIVRNAAKVSLRG